MKFVKVGLISLIFTLFFSLWFLEKQSPFVEASNHIQVDINSVKPECTVTLTADGHVIASVSMPEGRCNIYLSKREKR